MNREALQPYAILAFVAGLIYLFLLFVWPLMVPFFLALALAALIERPVRFLEERRIPRTVGISVSLLILLLVVGLMLIYGLATLAIELAQFSRALPDLWNGFIEATEELQHFLESITERIPTDVGSILDEQRDALLDLLLTSVGQLLELVRRWTFQGVPNTLINLMIAGVATFLMSRDKEGILAFLPRLLPARWRPQSAEVVQSFVVSAIGFFNALVILVTITAVITVLSLSILGSPYALLLGVMMGLLDLIPVIGPGLIFLPWIVYHLFLGDAIFGLWLAVLYGSLSVIRTVLEPRIIGKRIGIHPLSTLIALYVGLRLYGVAGFVIGPMVAILLKSLDQTGLLAHKEDDDQPAEPKQA